MNVYELNMDGLVGPSHHYAGLSTGNVASLRYAHTAANPAAAAKQGLEKMRFLHRAGFKQAILPPHQRPNLELLYALGFQGSIATQLEQAKKTSLDILSACYSASSMWTANAATVSPSMDTKDHRVHFTAANLINKLHRHQEAPFSEQLLRRIFADPRYFHHHAPLPATTMMSDEGAANHTRLSQKHGSAGIHLFAYGKQTLPTSLRTPGPIRYPARQTREASEAIARNHLLSDSQLIFAQQHPDAIDQGVFHCDVIGVGNESVFFVHEKAFLNQKATYDAIRKKANFEPLIVEVKEAELSVADAVKLYLFNSQLLTIPGKNTMMILAPSECEEHLPTRELIASLIADSRNPIVDVHYFNLKQSMQNGGGPACLRLRVVLNETELNAMHQGIIVTDPLLDTLENWVDRYYRDRLDANDLVDPAFVDENFAALDALTQLLALGSIYPFQYIGA